MNSRQARLLNLIVHNSANPLVTSELARIVGELTTCTENAAGLFDADPLTVDERMSDRYKGRNLSAEEKKAVKDKLEDEKTARVRKRYKKVVNLTASDLEYLHTHEYFIALQKNMVRGSELVSDPDNPRYVATRRGWERLGLWKENKGATVMQGWQAWELEEIAPIEPASDSRGRPVIAIPPLRPNSAKDFIVRLKLTALDDLYLQRRCYRTGRPTPEGAVQNMLGNLERERGDMAVTGKPLPSAGPPRIAALSESLIKRLRGYVYLDEEVAIANATFSPEPPSAGLLDVPLNNFERMALDNQQAASPYAYGLDDGEAVIALVRREEEVLGAIAEKVGEFIKGCLDGSVDLSPGTKEGAESRKLLAVIPEPFLAKYGGLELYRILEPVYSSPYTRDSGSKMT